MPSPHGLGKGLDALIPDTEESTEVSVEQIQPLPNQPRRRFPEEALRELAESISQHGIIQPLVVTKSDEGYQLIAGERRLRAAKIAGLRVVPVVIRSVDEQGNYELALIENLQRSDLTAVEEARAFHKLLTDFNLTQAALAARVGKSRPAIANTLRLLALESDMLAALESGAITAGHASALLAHEGSARRTLFELIKRDRLSVRQAEAWRGTSVTKQKDRTSTQPDWIKDVERSLGTKVIQRGSENRGSLIISYDSRSQLTELVDRLRQDS